ncbi:hypothetical protein ACQPYE_19040 [Actinosynnema sp. CA-299493]
MSTSDAADQAVAPTTPIIGAKSVPRALARLATLLFPFLPTPARIVAGVLPSPPGQPVLVRALDPFGAFSYSATRGELVLGDERPPGRMRGRNGGRPTGGTPGLLVGWGGHEHKDLRFRP